MRWGSTLPSEQLARILYHVPFCKMARKAHAQVRLCDLEDAPGAAAIHGRGARGGRRSRRPATTRRWRRRWALNARVGNVYTASLYLALAGLLHAEGAALAGQRIGLLSYGSGCCAEFFSGVVGEKAAERMARADLDAVLAKRERVSVEEYERMMNLPYDAPEALAPGAGHVPAGGDPRAPPQVRGRVVRSHGGAVSTGDAR